MNYTRTLQHDPRIVDISTFPFSDVSFNVSIYGYNSLHPGNLMKQIGSKREYLYFCLHHRSLRLRDCYRLSCILMLLADIHR